MKSPRQQYFFHIARIFIVHSFIGCFSVLFKTIINIIYNKEWHSIQKIIFGLFLLEECFKYLDVYKYTFVKHSYHKQFFYLSLVAYMSPSSTLPRRASRGLSLSLLSVPVHVHSAPS